MRDGFVTAERVGAGFMMLRRSAVERLVAAYPETKYNSAPTYPPALRTSDNQYDSVRVRRRSRHGRLPD